MPEEMDDQSLNGDEQDAQKSFEEEDFEDDSQDSEDKTDYKALYEKEKAMRQGLVTKLKATSSKKSESKADPELTKRLETLELEALGDVSDEIREEVKKYSKLNGVSLKQALKSDYIQFKVSQEEKKRTEEEASISSKGGASQPKKSDYSKMNPEKDFDLSTEEGRKDWEGYKAWMKKQG
jgi:hypothetical protein